jgi:Mrp family chromosome partitioning ATPase
MKILPEKEPLVSSSTARTPAAIPFTGTAGAAVASALAPAPAGRRRSSPRIDGRILDEEMRLVQRVFFGPSRARTVVFCGVEPRNGASSICARAAEILSSEGNRPVCVIDANLRNPALHNCFNASNTTGWTDAIAQPASVHHYVQPLTPSLFLLTAGSSLAGIHSALAAGLPSVLRELQIAFNFILIDAPPAALYPDAGFIAQPTDGVVLVVEANVTNRCAAMAAKDSLERAECRVLAAVLNKRTFPVPEHIYRRL